MHQQIAVMTLSVADLNRSRRFYVDGFRWKPVFENEEIFFYQMNCFVFATWLRASLAADAGRRELASPGAFALAHNVLKREDVQPTMDRLCRFGGSLLKEPWSRRMAGLATTSRTPTTTHGKSHGTRLGQSIQKDASLFLSEADRQQMLHDGETKREKTYA
jgi:uncharacterized protein